MRSPEKKKHFAGQQLVMVFSMLLADGRNKNAVRSQLFFTSKTSSCLDMAHGAGALVLWRFG